ncbi:SDR family NAD(P)-dependent oxidoreductase [Streptomyces sp. NPDC003393]|jgi:NAD(P)-dependent dehydrogenase (short-subunit alcohol dehydrogenase family)
MNDHFKDRVVIVTGAGSGIGAASAVKFAEAGAHVLAVGRREGPLKETAGRHPRIAAFVADVCAPDGPESIIGQALDGWGRVDVLVNNAGVFASMDLQQSTRAGIDRIWATNVTAPSLLSAAALPHLRAHRGAIINLSSTFGHRPLAHASHYGASKAAIEHLTRSWALELASDGVRVNAIAPGPTESEALASGGLTPEQVAEVKAAEAARIPMGRRGEPEELAEWIVRMADPRSAWMTGQVLTVDGGLELT